MSDYMFEVIEDESGEQFARGETSDEQTCFNEGMNYLQSAGVGHTLRLWKLDGEISLTEVTRKVVRIARAALTYARSGHVADRLALQAALEPITDSGDVSDGR